MEPRRTGGLARHLEGWQPALLCVFLAGSAAVLAVPRPVDPREVPPPMADPRALELAYSADEALADAAEREGLDADVRALGSAMRAYGVADAAGDERALVEARAALVTAAGRAMAVGEESVLRLRAYQLRSFLREVRRWEMTGEESAELLALGGGFVRMLLRNNWCRDSASEGVSSGARRRVLMDDAAQRTAWKRRWNEVVGVQSRAFEPALDEQRAFFRFLLAHPLGSPGASPATSPATSPAPLRAPAAQTTYEDLYRLKKIEELSALDPVYPRDLARGIVLYKLGRYLHAVEAFRRHLDASPDGPFTLRTQNYLRAALGRVQEP